MKPIPGHEGRYSATEDGRIYSHLSDKFLKPARAGDRREYLSVQLGRGNREYVHSLVLLAFKGECPAGMQARHLDGNSENNADWNLEWATPRINTLDKNAHQTMLRGDRHQNTVLPDADVARLIARREQGIGFPQLGREFGISKSQAHRICAGTSRKA